MDYYSGLNVATLYPLLCSGCEYSDHATKKVNYSWFPSNVCLHLVWESVDQLRLINTLSGTQSLDLGQRI